MRPSAARANRLSPAERQAFAVDVADYLTRSPRQLPSRYLYDALGSALFEAICELPWYGITRAERALLERHGAEILARVQPVSTLVELGPGSGAKLATLLDTRPSPRSVAVHLVDVSAAALDLSARTLREIDGVHVVPHQATYEAGLLEIASARRGPSGRMLALFLGSNIGNFDPPGAHVFLREIRASLLHGDALLVGADLVKPESDLLRAYDDPLGITAAFNRNLLVRINRELGGDVPLEDFAHRAVWNPAHARVEMHLVARAQARVRIPAASLDLVFERDETIWTESSYKYEPSGVVAMLEQAGFERVDQWIDRSARFAITLVEAV
jgi:L-histidine Nalpha-methyltransferase